MKAWLTNLQERWKETLDLYGKVALAVYVSIFVCTMTGFWTAIHFGIDIGTSAAELGSVGAAWAATKILQPFRIGATLVLTPFVATLLGRTPPEA